MLVKCYTDEGKIITIMRECIDAIGETSGLPGSFETAITWHSGGSCCCAYSYAPAEEVTEWVWRTRDELGWKILDITDPTEGNGSC